MNFFRPEVTRYIDDVIHLVKEALSSPESALLLRDMYDTEFISSKHHPLAERVFGATLKREDESMDSYTSLPGVIDDFVNYDIYKLFGLTIKDFLQLTTKEKNAICEKARVLMERLAAEMENISGEVDNNIKELKSTHNRGNYE